MYFGEDTLFRNSLVLFEEIYNAFDMALKIADIKKSRNKISL